MSLAIRGGIAQTQNNKGSLKETASPRSSSYAPRTQVNASSADLTVAFATDYATAGERLTMKMAGYRYVAVPLELDPP